MSRFSANSRATISSTAIFLSQQSRQYFSSPRGSETSFAPQRGQRDSAAVRRDIRPLYSGTGGGPPPGPLALQSHGRLVHLLDVFLDHAPRAEVGRDGADRLLHQADPAARDVLLVALVVGRHDLLLEEPVERAGVRGVHRVVVAALDPGVDQEPVGPCVALGPPAVADA